MSSAIASHLDEAVRLAPELRQFIVHAGALARGSTEQRRRALDALTDLAAPLIEPNPRAAAALLYAVSELAGDLAREASEPGARGNTARSSTRRGGEESG